MKIQKVVVIIPTYNEKGNIGRCIEALQKVFPQCPSHYEMNILVVDDSSPDGTAKEVKAKQKKFENLHLLNNPKKMGLGGAYLAGMKHATEKFDADLLFEFDADLSHDPEIMPQFLQKIDEGYDFVLGSRYIKGGSIPANWPLLRKFYSVVGNFVIMTVMTDFRIRDWTTGYRAIKRKVYETVHKKLDKERFSGYTFQIGFLHNVIRQNYKVAEVPLNFVDRTLGRSKLGKEYIKNTLVYIFTTRFKDFARFFKFLIVGGTGLVLQTLLYLLLSKPTSPAIATIIGGQLAILSNFILNNLWTFKDRKLISLGKILISLVKFYLTSNIAVIIIQGGIMKLGENLVDPETIYIHGFYVLAMALTLVWNYTIYNRFIWKKDK